MQTPNEQNQQAQEKPVQEKTGQQKPAQEPSEAARKPQHKAFAEPRKSSGKDRHQHHGKRGEGRHGEAKPLPQGALQNAMRDAAGDWKAFRAEQTALGRSQKSFWLTEEEAWRVRNYIRKIREKAEKHQKILAEQARGKAERQAQALAKALTESMTSSQSEQPRSETAAETNQ